MLLTPEHDIQIRQHEPTQPLFNPVIDSAQKQEEPKTNHQCLQVGDSFVNLSDKDNKTQVHHITEDISVNKMEGVKPPEPELSPQDCMIFLLKTLLAKMGVAHREIIQLLLLLSLLFFGIEVTIFFGILNLIYHLVTGNSKIPEVKQKPPDINQTPRESKVQMVQKAFENLQVPRTHHLTMKKIRKRLESKRKKKEHRDIYDTGSEDDLQEEEVYLAPSVPSNIPDSSKFTIKGEIGTEEAQFEIDTGSAISILNRATFERLDSNQILDQRMPRRKYRDFSGQEIPFLTEALLQVKLGNLLVKHYFLITNGASMSNLIGIDLIRSKRLNIEIDDNSYVFLTFKNREKQIRQKVEIEENKEFTLLVSETVEVDELGITNVPTRFESTTVNKIDTSSLYNVMGVARINLDPFPFKETLASIDIDGRISVPIENRILGKTTLFAGQEIGKFTPLSVGDEVFNNRDKTTDIVGGDFKFQPNLHNTIVKLEKNISKDTNGKEEGVNRIKLTNNPSDTSEACNESDLAEEMLPTRIPDKPGVWSEVLQDVPVHFRRRVFHLLTKDFPNIVSKGNTDIGLCTLENSEFKIEINDPTPFSCKPYNLNRVYEMELKEIIGEMQDTGLLLPESSPYSSGVFIRPRPDSTNTGNCRVRVINDYRALNKVTTPDRFPLPSMKMLMSKLSGKKYFILLDLKDSYMSIPIRESDRFKASILTSFGQFAPTRMSYGFKNAPSWFSRQIARVVNGLTNCTWYMDDILCTGTTELECIEAFEAVVARLDKAGFKISLGKLKMFRDNLKLLGVIVNKDGIQCDPAKVDGITAFPEPTCKQQVQRFLGMLNFISDFIPNYSLTSAPLYKLTSADVEAVTLNQEQRKSFLDLKVKASKPTLLSFIDPELPVYLETDASGLAYGAVAYQVQEYSESDIPALKLEHEETMNKTKEELDDDLKGIIEAYVNNEEVPDYNHTENPSNCSQTSEGAFQSPFLTKEIKPTKKKNKVYIPKTIFFVSKKFSESQARGWSSLMKELTAILDVVEKRADHLALAKETIILSDCSACTYLFHQAKSNSLMSRYMARLSCYPFRIMVKHKAGEKLTLADNLSRLYTIDQEEYSKGKISHTQGIIVKNRFRLGSVITPSDIIQELELNEDQLVMSACDERITKSCQTGCSETADTINNISSVKDQILKEVRESLSFEKYTSAQREEFPELYQKLLTGEDKGYQLENGLILTKYKNRWVRLAPPSLRNAIMSRTHLLGHYASKTLMKLITQSDVWPHIRKDTQDFCATCLSCLWIRPKRGADHRLGLPLTGDVNSVVQIDVVSGLPNANGFSFFVSVIDVFSRFTIVFPLRKDRAHEIVSKLETYVFSPFGSPRIILSDGAMNLGKSKKFQSLCNLYGTKIKIRSPYSSRSLGTCERVHRSILDLLRSLGDSFESNWVQNLPLATAIYNSTPHSMTNLSPYEIRFGYSNRMWDPLVDTSLLKLKNTNLQNYHRELRAKLKEAYNTAKKFDDVNKAKMRERFGGKISNYQEGSFVLAQNKTPCVNEKIKFRDKWYGPFLVRDNLTGVVVAENILNGQTSYLNKNLIKILPEKSVQRYNDMPLYAKRIFGAGVSWQEWKNLHEEGKLKDFLKTRKIEFDYGIERPFEPPHQPVMEAPEERIEIQPPNDRQTDDTSDEPDLNELTPNRDKQVSFRIPEESERPKRVIRAPSRLDL